MTIGTNREIILMGDLNNRVGKKSKDEVVGPHGEDRINDNGERLIELCNNNEMKIRR